MVNESNDDQQKHDTCSSESEDEVTVISISACPVSKKEAVQLFEKCIVWLQHQPKSTVYSTTTLLMSLKDLAAKKDFPNKSNYISLHSCNHSLYTIQSHVHNTVNLVTIQLSEQFPLSEQHS